ncbi:MAG: glutamate-1-semialdehyde 2,1-aminomutase [Solirubrobacterales bacterium]
MTEYPHAVHRDADAESFARSQELYRAALDLMPGGVNSPVRALRQVGRDPIFFSHGEGCELVDVDGNRYLDYVCSWGPLIWGHAHPPVVEAVRDAAGRGTSFGAPNEHEVLLAAEMADRVPSVEMVRMTSSGTEAAMTAVRLGRAATSRETVIKFAGAYHGHVDGLLVEAGSGLATAGIPASPGVTEGQAAATVVVPWNDREAVERALAEHEVAAILAEPIPANMGVVPPAGDFLEFLRAQADASGALLVFDEVITGFRVARGGAQELYGVQPDLTVLGKVVGGGLPAAALGGPRKLLERLAPAGPVYQAGTLSGNPLAMVAGLATLEGLDAEAYERLDDASEQLADGILDRAQVWGVPLSTGRAPGMFTPFFGSEPVTDFATSAAGDHGAYAHFWRGMLDRGIYGPPSPFEAWFPSLVHDGDAIDRTIEAAGEVFREVAQ